MATNNTSLKDRYNAALREYNCCKSLVGLYPNQYTKPLEKAKKELDELKKQIQIAETANIIAAAVDKATENQKKKDSSEPVKVEKKQEKKESKKDSSEPVVEKKQEEKKESESKKDSNSHKEVKSKEQQPKEEVKAAKELSDEDIQEKNIQEKNKIEEAYLKKHSPKPWKQFMLFSDEQMLSAVKESGIKSIVPLENYSRSQLDAVAWYISKYPGDDRMIYVPRLTSKLEDILKSSKYNFDDFDLVIKEPNQWVYISSELNADGKVIKLAVPATVKKKVKIIPPEQEAQSEQIPEQTIQQQIDSINPFLELQSNPGRLIPGYSSR